jgi:hypothetical protein
VGAANVYIRGGLPAIVDGATSATLNTTEEWHWRDRLAAPSGGVQAYGTANWLRVECPSTNTQPVVISFREEDANAGIGIPVAAGAVVELPVEIGRFYTRAAAASQAFTALVTVRRGG